MHESIVGNRANISEAVARSRRMRRAMHRRRQRLALAGCLAAAAGVPLSLSLVGVTGNDVVHAAVSGANSLADLLGKRSPGERTTAQLTKTKHAKRPSYAVAPPDRQSIAPRAIRKHDFDEVAQLLVAPPPTVDILPPFEEASVAAPTIGDVVGSTPGIFATPPGGGGGSSSFPASDPPRQPVPAVPEPATWATMLLGFAIMGWRMRRHPAMHAVRKTAA